MRAHGVFVCAVMAAAVMSGAARLSAQHSYTRSELENGARLYLGSCATCHGARGDMVRGVALMSGRFQRASTDEELVKIIISGIAGTAMPPNNYTDLEAGMIVAYLRGTAAGDSVTVTAGDSTRGKALFEGKGKCGVCHSATSRTAPPLSDIGMLRRPLELEQSILDPSAVLNANYRFARVVTKTGTRRHGTTAEPEHLLGATARQHGAASCVRPVGAARVRRHQDVTDAVCPRRARFPGSGRCRDLPDQPARPAMTQRLLAVSCAAAALVLCAAGTALHAQITSDRIARAAAEPDNWLTYSGDVSGRRHSPLTQITPANVKNLELQWVFQAQSLEKFEATPLAVDGVLYTVQPPNDIVALDGTTGRIFWTYSYKPSTQARPCCGRVNRGLAILGDRLFMGTIDGHLLAVDAKSGQPIWNVAVAGARPEAGYAITVAPQVVKDKIIVGPAGGDFGVRGFIAAYDPASGKELWRFYTIPGPGEAGHESWAGDSWQHGGGAVWVTGSYDPELNLVYWGTGNPGPDFNGDNRAGDNLYSDSVVALDPDTGKLKWHFQFTPHDEFDYDSTQVPVLADIVWQGRPRKVVLWANRNGFWYVLDRATGEFLSGRPFAKVTWTESLDPTRPPHERREALCRRHGRVPASRRRHELVFAVVQPPHRAVLRAGLDQHVGHVRETAGRIRRGPCVSRRVPDRGRDRHQRRARQPPAPRRRNGRHRRPRSEDR